MRNPMFAAVAAAVSLYANTANASNCPAQDFTISDDASIEVLASALDGNTCSVIDGNLAIANTGPMPETGREGKTPSSMSKLDNLSPYSAIDAENAVIEGNVIIQLNTILPVGYTASIS
ncbi:hypothetical protein [Halioglobus sp. HI00S01]|uniref:hypothetical protein n=1 Tax=Halioglobus sp. HI00S01 TaxID=1822214 RepID=UPI0012E90D68|nr:hypothetical protein [Halioglobus sp. HI00S01]